MADVTEIEALKASLRGARASAEELSTIAARVDAGDAHADVSGADLDDLQRLLGCKGDCGAGLHRYSDSSIA